jgi:hypothetical protein
MKTTLKPINLLYQARNPGWYIDYISEKNTTLHLLEAKANQNKEIVAVCKLEYLELKADAPKAGKRWVWTAKTTVGKWLILKKTTNFLEYQVDIIDFESSDLVAKIELKTYHKGILYAPNQKKYTWKTLSIWGTNYGWFENKKLIFKANKDVFGFFRTKPQYNQLSDLDLSLFSIASYFLLLYISPPKHGFNFDVFNELLGMEE